MPEPLLETLVDAPVGFHLISLTDRPWAMSRTGLAALIAACSTVDIDAVASRRGQPVEGARGILNHRGAAVLNVRGPLFTYRSIWTWLLGATSVEETDANLRAALDDPAVQRIVLNINSPGGQIDGINELANSIRVANQIKPVTAYVGGLAASGAYWLASAAGRIVADETAQLGSIGVVATIVDDREAEAKAGVKRYEFVSSQSPLKRADPGSDQGRTQIQQMVDALAQVFIEKVAGFRGTTEAKVVNDFGRGGVRPANDAVANGMADALGSFDGVLALAEDATGGRRTLVAAAAAVSTSDEGQGGDDEECDCPPGEDCNCDEQEAAAATPALEGEALMTPTEERQRIAAILTCEEARGREELARTLALETNLTLEAVQKVLKTSPAAAANNPLETAMSQVPNPQVGITTEKPPDNSVEAHVASILAYVPAARKYPVKVQ